MGIFGAQKKEELVALFDIGSASVSGALVRMHSGSDKVQKKPTIIFTTTVILPLEENQTFESFAGRMEKALEEAAHRMKEIRLGAPKKAFVFLASPWYASEIRTVKYSKAVPFTFTEKLLLELVNKEVALFEGGDLKKFGTPESITLIEAKNIEVKLNGYATSDPYGKEAKEVELTIFLSMSPKSILAQVERAIEKSFTIPRINFFSFLFSSFIVTRNLFAHDEQFLLLDIAGEVTDLSIVKGSNLVASASFPLGKNFLLRKLIAGLGKTLPEVSSLLALYLAKGLDEAAILPLLSILEEAKKEWLDAFQKSLFSITDELAVPEKVFVTTDLDVAPWFFEVIQKEEFSQYVLSEKKFNVILVGASALCDYCTCMPEIERNSFIMLETIFIAEALHH